MSLPEQVRIVEVGPRDGLQNEKQRVDTDTKVELIARLGKAGLKAIEATSFVSPKWVPQMADNAEVMARIVRLPGVAYPVLTPNLKGFEAALAAGAEEVAVFAAASGVLQPEEHQLLDRRVAAALRALMAAAGAAGVRCAAMCPCVLGCPTRARSNLPRWPTWRPPWRRWAATRSASATPSAPARPGRPAG